MKTHFYFQVISVEMCAVECKQGIQSEGKNYTKSEFLSENWISRDKEKEGRRNHRIIGVDEDLLRSSSSTHLLKQGHLERVA